MAFTRRGSKRRDDGIIWPGFVDAVTTLLMVLIFVLTIFTVMQSVLRQTLTSQSDEISTLSGQVADLSAQLGLSQRQNTELKGDLVLSDRQKEALNASLLAAEAEIKAQQEAARLARARAEATEALIADLRRDHSAQTEKLSQAEAEHLVDQAALAALRGKLAASDEEVNALLLELEARRKEAQEVMALLQDGQPPATDLKSSAEAFLRSNQNRQRDADLRLSLLNSQINDLRKQLDMVQAVLSTAKQQDSSQKTEITSLNTQLNAALAQIAADQKRRAELEEAERKRLEAQARDLEKFRSEFFGQLSTLLAGRKGVRIVGDRFVFSSEVLFPQGSADLLPEGRLQISSVVDGLNEISAKIPPNINWIIRVDGHTDNIPLSGNGLYKDNWELSQARALAVVRYMQNDLGFPPQHLAATGFGEWQPAAMGDTVEARAQNRRIELKLTER